MLQDVAPLGDAAEYITIAVCDAPTLPQWVLMAPATVRSSLLPAIVTSQAANQPLTTFRAFSQLPRPILPNPATIHAPYGNAVALR